VALLTSGRIPSLTGFTLISIYYQGPSKSSFKLDYPNCFSQLEYAHSCMSCWYLWIESKVNSNAS
jgi:hypothetical protein